MAKLSRTALPDLWGCNFALVNHMAQNNTEREIAAIISGALKQHREVTVRGFGTFTVHHNRQEHRQEKDGRILMAPPSDVITFTPEK